MKKRRIYTSYSPNTRIKDLLLDIAILFQPYSWFRGYYPSKIEEWFRNQYMTDNVFTYNYARSAIYEFLRAAGIGQNDEVIVPAFTCVAAINPVLWTGAKAVYADIDETYLSPGLGSFQKAFTDKTKAIFIQHTFGLSGDLEKTVDWAQEKGLIVLEDCTQVLNPFSQRQKILGTLGDAAVFSFGRDKVVSGVDGGGLGVNNNEFVEKMRNQQDLLKYPPTSWLLKEILYPLLWAKIKFGMKFGKLGKLLHYIFTKSGLLTRATDADEKLGLKPSYIPARLPNALARLAYRQLNDLEELNKHRAEISSIYDSGLKAISGVKRFSFPAGTILLRYPLLVRDAEKLNKYCTDRGIVLGDWYKTPVAPAEADINAAGYHSGDAPIAESVCSQIINLPTSININSSDAKYIVDVIKEFYLERS